MKIIAVMLTFLMGVLIALATALALSMIRKRKRKAVFTADSDESDPGDAPHTLGNQRRHLRVTYPDDRQPLIRIRKHRLPVADISEKGLCFLNTGKIKLGKWVRGEVTLHMGSTLVVEGQVVRKQNGAIGLSLITPIPYKTIVAEGRLTAEQTNSGPAQ
ncbi:MAG: PilZ domain-containing protein [Desulfobacterales bacterium]